MRAAMYDFSALLFRAEPPFSGGFHRSHRFASPHGAFGRALVQLIKRDILLPAVRNRASFMV
jgi:hypothetical protein